jgi:hypothetical protein
MKGDRSVSTQLTVEIYRAMKSQTYRVSFAEVWINDIFYGFESMEEKFDEEFTVSRFGVESSIQFSQRIGEIGFV